MCRLTYGHIGAAGASIYSASKHAVEGLTKSAALEAATSGVRINMVAPGPIETAMLKRFTRINERKAGLATTVLLKRVGRPEEVAQTILFLSRPTRRHSSHVRRTSWTAERQPSDSRRSNLSWPRLCGTSSPVAMTAVTHGGSIYGPRIEWRKGFGRESNSLSCRTR